MAERLAGELSHVIDSAAFRRDAATFLSLPQASVDRLMALVENHATFDVPATDLTEFEKACNLEGQGRHVLAAAQLIRSAVRRVDQEERQTALIDFASSMKVKSFEPEHFSQFFSALPNLEREDLRSAAIAVAPTLVDSRLYSDLRVVSHGSVVDWELVPVVVARLGFDENIAGQQALFIQLTEESLADLKREIERAEHVLRAIHDRLGERIRLGKENDTD